jgi:hypothetical protein
MRELRLPFVFVPGECVLIAPWPKCRASFVEEQRLTEVLDRVACSRPSAPVWIWPAGGCNSDW